MLSDKNCIKWGKLTEGILVKRYKRFLADIRLKSGELITAHCANSGRMISCADPGQPVYVTHHDNPKRKLKYTWEIIKMPTSYVGVNTMIPNKLVKLSIEAGIVKELNGYDSVKSEVKVGDKSRLDIMLEKDNGERCFVEVKNCTLVEEGKAYFPDAVTTRGLKHIHELIALKKSGHRTVMFYLIQRMDATLFRPAGKIDIEYAKALKKAFQAGVEIVVYDVDINLQEIKLRKAIPFKL